MGKKNKNKGQGNAANPPEESAGAHPTPPAAGAQGQQPPPAQQAGPSQSSNVPSSQAQEKQGGQQSQNQGARQQRRQQQGDGAWGGQEKQQPKQQQHQKGGKQNQPDSQQQQGEEKHSDPQKYQGKQKQKGEKQSDTQPQDQWRQSKEHHQQGGQQKQQQGQQQQGQRGPPQGQQQHGGPQQGQRGPPQGQQQQGQRGPPQGQQQQGQRGPPQGQQQQGQRGPPQGQQQQGQWGPPQGQQQQAQWGPPQGQKPQGQWGPQQGQQQQQDQRGPPQGQQAQRGPAQAQQQPAQRGPPQGQQQQGQRGTPQGQQQQGQRGPPQGQQQQGQWGPPQGQQQQAQWGPPQGQKPQGQWGPQQGQQQQQDQRGPPQGQQAQRGPAQAQQQPAQRGPPQGQQQQGQRGPPQGQQQQGQRGPPQGQQQQGQRGPQQQPSQPQISASSSTQSLRSSSTTSSTASLSSASKGNIPRGTQGRPGTVEVNYLNIDLNKMPNIAYHYDVVITPDRPKKFIRPAFEQFNRQCFPNIAMAYDGRASFYTVEKLEKSPFEAEIQLADSGSRTITFKITIKETMDMEIDLNSLRNYFQNRIFDKPMRALQCLEVVLSNPCHTKGVRVGRSFFTKPKNHMDLGDGYEMWTGLYQAAILGDAPFLNVDISNKSFPSECYLIEYITRNFRDISLNQPLDRYKVQDLRTFLNCVNIVYEPPACFGSFARTYKVLDVPEQSADKLMFQLEDGTKLSVAQYFNSKGYKLKYPGFNCLQVGSTVKKNYVPIELCKIPPGQSLNKKDGPRQVQQMIKYAATSTNVRKGKIMDMLEYFEHNRDIKIQKFGIRIGNAFTVVPMRLLNSPSVEYFSREMIRPFKGAWRMNPNSKFLITKQINNGHQWAVIYSKRSRINYNTLQNFAGMVYDLSKKLNMTLAPKPEIMTFENVLETLRNLNHKKYDLVFVVIPRFGTTYADIKQAAELKVGQLTQCIMENTIERRCDTQTVSNILLKVNGKLNGTNHRINPETNIPLKNVMFLGADVTHPSPDQKHIPSVVGVAASHDENGACYNMQYRLQRSTVENIEEMDSIFTQHMRVYFKYQGKYPDHIIYYRDGVSDGQFPIVKRNELRDIRSACTRLRCSPKITCIVVVKRHHTRFFPQTVNPRDKFNNVEPGTVVDKLIVHPNEVEFFMVSHQSIQGTAKPTRYNVIVDEAKMNIDDLQKLTYNLCHMFPRCNRVVSYPAPAYLAHLVAFRGRVYIEGTRQFAEPKKEYEKRLVNSDFMQCNPMYFI